MKLILASNSPRRKELLSKFNYPFEIHVSNVDETMDKDKDFIENTKEVSKRKALAVYNIYEDSVVLACDTIVVFEGRVYGKPKDDLDAINTLKLLSGKTHEVVSAVTIIYSDKIIEFYDTSYVTFKNLTLKEIEEYVATGEPKDKAGSYAIQGIGRKLISKYEGSLDNIIGLPTEKLKPYLVKIFGE